MCTGGTVCGLLTPYAGLASKLDSVHSPSPLMRFDACHVLGQTIQVWILELALIRAWFPFLAISYLPHPSDVFQLLV